MGRPSTYPPAAGRAFFTADDSRRFRQLADRLGSIRAAREALGVNQIMFENATGLGRVMPATRTRLLEKLTEAEAIADIDAEDPALTVDEVMAVLGVGEMAAYRAMKQAGVEHVGPQRIRVRRSTLERWRKGAA